MELIAIISKIKKQLELEYGLAVFDVSVKKNKTGFVFSGYVLSDNQKSAIFAAIGDLGGGMVIDRIKVLSDPQNTSLGWCVVKGSGLPLKNRFVTREIANKKILKRITTDFLNRNEILRILFKAGDQLLVQRADLVVGWVDRSGVVIKKESLKKKWNEGIYAKSGETISVEGSGDGVVEEARKYLGVKYVWSRKSADGMDCSALVQVAFKEAFNIVLPRHSWDQRKMGIPINIKQMKSGDLIFMLKKINGHKHVGIADFSGGRSRIIHACLCEKKVVEQDQEDVFENYEIVEVKRIIERKQ